MQAEACFETKTTKILALNTKFCKKSLASKLKGLLKSVALNPDSRKVLFRNEKVYWKRWNILLRQPTRGAEIPENGKLKERKQKQNLSKLQWDLDGPDTAISWVYTKKQL